MEQTTVFLSLGTNLGDRVQNIDRAIRSIEQTAGRVSKRSSFYQTPPWGYVSENEYLNCCVQLQTELSPIHLLKSLKFIEHSMGRTVSQHYTDRTIDIDILFYGTESINTADLTIPHPKLSQRAFVLFPLNEIAPTWIHPELFMTISQLFSPYHRLKEIKVYKFAD